VPTPAAIGAMCLHGGELCGECSEGEFRDYSGTCSTCPSAHSTLERVGVIAAVVGAVYAVALLLVVVVQTAFRQPVLSGVGRALRFSGWVVAILALQAQVGRTASAIQPAELMNWYRLLQVFELNPDGVRPHGCGASGVAVQCIVMALATAAALLFMLLGLPCARECGARAGALCCQKRWEQRGDQIAQRAAWHRKWHTKRAAARGGSDGEFGVELNASGFALGRGDAKVLGGVVDRRGSINLEVAAVVPLGMEVAAPARFHSADLTKSRASKMGSADFDFSQRLSAGKRKASALLAKVIVPFRRSHGGGRASQSPRHGRGDSGLLETIASSHSMVGADDDDVFFGASSASSRRRDSAGDPDGLCLVDGVGDGGDDGDDDDDDAHAINDHGEKTAHVHPRGSVLRAAFSRSMDDVMRGERPPLGDARSAFERRSATLAHQAQARQRLSVAVGRMRGSVSASDGGGGGGRAFAFGLSTLTQGGGARVATKPRRKLPKSMTRASRGGANAASSGVILANPALTPGELGAAADEEGEGAPHRLCCRSQHKLKGAGDRLTPRQHGDRCLGMLRRALAGVVLLLHPLCANFAFQAVHCAPHPATGIPVLAASPSTPCFGPTHVGVFILGAVTIAVEVVAFPLVVVVTLAVSIGWLDSVCRRDVGSHRHHDHDHEREQSSDHTTALVILSNRADLSPVSGGLCCRCLCCVNHLAKTRRAYLSTHAKRGQIGRRIAFSSFTRQDYKPEFFWMCVPSPPPRAQARALLAARPPVLRPRAHPVAPPSRAGASCSSPRSPCSPPATPSSTRGECSSTPSRKTRSR
jgi:hypothetical protein